MAQHLEAGDGAQVGQVAVEVAEPGHVPAHHPHPPLVRPHQEARRHAGVVQAGGPGAVVAGGLQVQRAHPDGGHGVDLGDRHRRSSPAAGDPATVAHVVGIHPGAHAACMAPGRARPAAACQQGRQAGEGCTGGYRLAAQRVPGHRDHLGGGQQVTRAMPATVRRLPTRARYRSEG